MNVLTRRAAARAFLAGLALLAAPAVGQSADVTIENEYLQVTWHEASGRTSIVARATGKAFLEDATLGEGGEAAAAVEAADPRLGAGQGIEITGVDGGIARLMLFPRQPFALIRVRRVNSTGEAATTAHVAALSGKIDLGAPTAELMTFGTGGLLAADDNPGSYAWLAAVEPKSRRGVVFGWMTHDRGSGVLFSKVEDDRVQIDARLDYGRLTLDPGQAEELETLAVGYFDDARLGLEAWADAVAAHYDVKLPPQPVGYCTWYSEPHGRASDAAHVAELAEFAKRELAPFGFSVVQIDDGWQAGVSKNGPKRNFTEHNPRGPYAAGMQVTAAQVASQGLTPGIWYMPFAGTHYDPFFKDRQDWFVKRADGKPYETAWGGTCLDLTNPEVREYVRSVGERIVREWGYRYLKLDGLWTGTATKQQYVNSGFKDDGMGDAVYHDPRVTNIEAYRSGLKLVREAVGPDVFILGCNGPQNMRSYGGAFGLVDAMRVGPDNGADWDHLLRGPQFGSRHYFLHGRVWYNDPDPVYVRASMPLEQAQLSCSWVAISGQLNLSSEWLPGLPAERLDVLKRTMPGHGLLPRPVDLFEHDPPRLWVLRDDRGAAPREVVGIFNWEDRELTIDEPLARLGLDEGAEYEAFDYWANEQLPPIAGRLKVAVPARSCRILAVRAAVDRPQLLSTSRHVTQGVVDVRDERWDAATRTLSGTSSVVGGDEYELRVVTPEGGKAWTVAAVEAGSASTTFSQDDRLIRATIAAPESGAVRWSVRFRE